MCDHARPHRGTAWPNAEVLPIALADCDLGLIEPLRDALQDRWSAQGRHVQAIRGRTAVDNDGIHYQYYVEVAVATQDQPLGQRIADTIFNAIACATIDRGALVDTTVAVEVFSVLPRPHVEGKLDADAILALSTALLAAAADIEDWLPA